MVENDQTNSIAFDKNEIELLWQKILEKFISRHSHLEVAPNITSKDFWTNPDLRPSFYEDFTSETMWEVSGIRKDSTVNSKEDISESYLYNHFYRRTENSFQIGYLNRIIYYLTNREIKNWSPYLQENGFVMNENANFIEQQRIVNANIVRENELEIGPGVLNLIGNWVSFNGNVENGYLALCYYKFYLKNNTILIEREGYNAERLFKGELFVQDDSSYIFDLTGENRNKRKFLIAHTTNIDPEILTCFGSAFADGRPVFVKEILIKLPESTQEPKIDGGEIVDDEKLKVRLRHFFNGQHLEIVKDEIENFLGKKEAPIFHLDALKNIKKHHLENIERELNPEIIKKKSSVYIHFNKLSKKKYTTKRNVVKYKKNRNNYIHDENEVNVSDEYIYMQICQYKTHKTQNHINIFKANHPDGIVDLQALFPLNKAELAIDSSTPFLQISHLEMDADSDVFVSNATFINDFSNSKKISLDYEVKTLKSELIIDFSSIEDFEFFKIGIINLEYSFNIPDGKKRQIIPIELTNKNCKGLTLNSIDKDNLKILFDETLDIDPKNPKIFAIKIDFQSEPGEYLYVHFNVDIP